MSIVCIDLDGTVNADPSFYKGEMRGLMSEGHEVHVLTGNLTAEHALAQIGMVATSRASPRCRPSTSPRQRSRT